MAHDRSVTPRQVDIVDQINDYSFKRYKMLRAILRYRRTDGRMSAPAERICFDGGDSVGVLLYDKAQRQVILVRQFRYPVHFRLAAGEARMGVERSWVLEIVAGHQEDGEPPENVARRETLEETGYAISGALERVAEVYATPGICSERIAIFLGEVDQSMPRASGGGLAAEGEDIEVVTIPFDEAMSMLERGEIVDAKTVIALQHLALRVRRTIETTDEHR